MIKIKSISKSYNKFEKVVENINLEIKDGEIFGFLGPNGAGKTTIIKMMTGVLEIDSGDIIIDKNSIIKNPVKAKENIGFVSDNPDIFLGLKGIEYLNFMADIYGISKELRIERIEKWSKKFKMDDVLEQKISNYSHGMRQKIVLIGVLVYEPKNWILDEPITGLDPKAIFDLKNAMKEHVEKGNCVFFSTHILEVAENLCDRVGIISKGKLVFVGTVNELKIECSENTSLENLFMEIVEND